MFKLAMISCVVSAAFAAPFTAELDSEWQLFKTAYNKQYGNDTESLRYGVMFCNKSCHNKTCIMHAPTTKAQSEHHMFYSLVG